MTVVQLTTLKKFVMCDDAKDTQGVDESPLNTLDPVRSIPKFINSPQFIGSLNEVGSLWKSVMLLKIRVVQMEKRIGIMMQTVFRMLMWISICGWCILKMRTKCK